jgi:hypothetical protein
MKEHSVPDLTVAQSMMNLGKNSVGRGRGGLAARPLARAGILHIAVSGLESQAFFQLSAPKNAAGPLFPGEEKTAPVFWPASCFLAGWRR